jgi:hypothetical protein
MPFDEREVCSYLGIAAGAVGSMPAGTYVGLAAMTAYPPAMAAGLALEVVRPYLSFQTAGGAVTAICNLVGDSFTESLPGLDFPTFEEPHVDSDSSALFDVDPVVNVHENDVPSLDLSFPNSEADQMVDFNIDQSSASSFDASGLNYDAPSFDADFSSFLDQSALSDQGSSSSFDSIDFSAVFVPDAVPGSDYHSDYSDSSYRSERPDGLDSAYEASQCRIAD